ncbi:MAG: FmdB family zinc ribbon protein [Polyangiales bacterium]
MPTYSYVCDACKREFEREQRISEDPIKKCPSCGKLKARRMITSGNFILKGGGWYSDGYGSSKGGSSKKDSAPSTSSKDASSTPSKDASSSTSSTPSPSKDTKPASTGSD